jgi:hypothetical protein
MSYHAHVLAYGPYSSNIADCLEFPAEFYEDLPRSSLVTTTLFDCVTGTQSETLAKALGFPMLDFSKHVDFHVGRKTKYKVLEDEWGDDAFVLKRLANAGFTFLYLLES